jgi:hypothetical protein
MVIRQYLTQPDGTIPPGVDVVALEAAGVLIVRPVDPPRTPGTMAVEGEPEQRDGVWWQTWGEVPVETPQPDIEALGAAVRDDRNARLAACDWTQLADAPVDSLAWANYRQALRDVPSQEGFPLAVEWPTPPA